MNDNQVITIVKIPKLLRNFIYQFKIRVSPVWAQIKVELKGDQAWLQFESTVKVRG